MSWQGRNIHLIGVGGAGMSGLAWAAHALGATVSGSDRAESSYLSRLRQAGVNVTIGQDPANLPEGAEVIVSTAISEENPELGQRPSFFVGGELPGAGPGGEAANSGWDEGEWVIVEADESDGSFLTLDPEVAVVTNIEMDHHARWANLAELRGAFADFAAKARAVVLPAGDGEMAEVLAERSSPEITGFDLAAPGPPELGLAVPGAHNRLNARAAIGALTAAGFDPDEVAAALKSFTGVKRRQELKGECEGARVFDDYAHHPTEVRAALTAIREVAPNRLIAAFQPHLYSRTKIFSQQFGAALALADEIVVVDVYPAREEPVGPLAGVSGLDVLRAAADRAGGRACYWAPDLEAAERVLRGRAGDDAVIVTIGAGDVTKLSDRLVAGG